MKRRHFVATVAAAATVLAAAHASAFCGFYVGGAGAELFNDASQVVLMRDGTKTILSMQNRYDGPVDDFALVIPVPEVLMEANVKTLDAAVFAKLDQLTAPRLVEYFEEDPCLTYEYEDFDSLNASPNSDPNVNPSPVVVEAQFEVGEYEIVVLSADESTALQTWLTDNDYAIPTGAAPFYQPYIDAGMYFFVARVDPAKVTFDDGRAVLSPLRFDYDSSDFLLPVRLGMINSNGQQDIIIHTLGRGQRYELANYDNVTIPTNLEVATDVKDGFGSFYKTLFARTVEQNPGAVVTEYSWQASSCDPCPGPVVDSSDLLTLGADVIGNEAEFDFSWVITRLHARYAKDDVGEDLRFQAADPIVGGREFVVGENGELEEGANPSEVNNFQARYIIRHPWTGEVSCEDPGTGRWGPPQTSGSAQGPTSTGSELTGGTDFDLVGGLVDDVPELGLEGAAERGKRSVSSNNGTGSGTNSGAGSGTKSEVGGCSSTTAPASGAAAFLVLVVGAVIRRRKRTSSSAS